MKQIFEVIKTNSQEKIQYKLSYYLDEDIFKMLNSDNITSLMEIFTRKAGKV